jgi:hypothetical protein
VAQQRAGAAASTGGQAEARMRSSAGAGAAVPEVATSLRSAVLQELALEDAAEAHEGSGGASFNAAAVAGDVAAMQAVNDPGVSLHSRRQPVPQQQQRAGAGGVSVASLDHSRVAHVAAGRGRVGGAGLGDAYRSAVPAGALGLADGAAQRARAAGHANAAVAAELLPPASASVSRFADEEAGDSAGLLRDAAAEAGRLVASLETRISRGSEGDMPLEAAAAFVHPAAMVDPRGAAAAAAEAARPFPELADVPPIPSGGERVGLYEEAAAALAAVPPPSRQRPL